MASTPTPTAGPRAGRPRRSARPHLPETDTVPVVNEVHLVGRVSGEPTVRELPSGDVVVTLRVVLRRARTGRGGAGVDTIDLACWSTTTRRTARRCVPGERIEVRGALRRRFFRAQGVPASRYEVEVASVRRV